MSSGVNTNRPIDSDLLATDAFRDPAYREAALQVVNRIRAQLQLPEADRLLAGYRGDTKWGNPVVFTIGAGAPFLAAYLDLSEHRIVVDSIHDETVFPLIKDSVVEQFIDRFEAGHYPELEA